MIQIVIDISEKQYEIAKEYVEIVDDKSLLAKAIRKGTPLTIEADNSESKEKDDIEAMLDHLWNDIADEESEG